MDKWIETITVEKLIQIIESYKDKKKEFIYKKNNIFVKSEIEECIYEIGGKNAFIRKNEFDIEFFFDEIDCIFYYEKIKKILEIRMFDNLKLNILDVEYFDVIREWSKLDQNIFNKEAFEKYINEEWQSYISKYEKYYYHGIRQGFKIRKEVFTTCDRRFIEFVGNFFRKKANIRIEEARFIIRLNCRAVSFKENIMKNFQYELLNLDEKPLEFKFKFYRNFIEIDFYISDVKSKGGNELEEVYMKVDNIFDMNTQMMKEWIKYMEGFQRDWEREEEEKRQIEEDYWSGLTGYERESIINMCEK